MSDQETAKQAAGTQAAAWVESGMVVGLGTGSTTAFALKALGARIQRDGLSVQGVPTSFAAERLARTVGIPLTTLDAHPTLDLALDGADEVAPGGALIKGRGAAHTREKVVATQADRFVVLADPSKTVQQLGTQAPLPVEVLPMAATPVQRRLEALGATVELRMGRGKDGPVVTDQGLWVLDATFPAGIDDAPAVRRALNDQPGVLDHGLFLDLATDVLIGQPDGSVRHETW
ncbi:ribose-5-phosphate isomerase RpiA [Salisaeta longa]|uniref:ribose-5-phosphate isomerase RpiA n=1 Tax=Salisaeta longa TaxID=503170 RepID=UPI0003B58F71|nr:ribose-5-phosphate isomerase RpiA [Salisaeta longa]